MFDKFEPVQLLRYGYGGFLLTGILALFAPTRLKEVIEAGGAVVAPLVILAIGTAVFVLHRYVLGELIFYPFTHFVHWLIDRLSKLYGQGEVSSATGYLGTKGVPFGLRRAAYTDIRRSLFSDNLRRRLDLDHSEVHILWITAVESAGAAAYLSSVETTHSPAVFWFFVMTTIATTISAMLLDIRLHRTEYRLLSSPKFNKQLEDFLCQRRYIRPP